MTDKEQGITNDEVWIPDNHYKPFSMSNKKENYWQKP